MKTRRCLGDVLLANIDIASGVSIILIGRTTQQWVPLIARLALLVLP